MRKMLKIMPMSFLVLAVFFTSAISLKAQGQARPNAKPIDHGMAYQGGAEQRLYAQLEERKRDHNGRSPRGSKEHRQRRRNHLEQFRMQKLLELIDLEENQKESFRKSFKSMRNELRKAYMQRKKITQRLISIIKDESIDEEKVNEIFETIEAKHQQQVKSRTDFMRRSKEILTAQQFGRLLVFQEQFDSQLLGQMGKWYRPLSAFRDSKAAKNSDGN